MSLTRPICQPLPPIKKDGRKWSAKRANLGARSLKPGHTRFYVGYKKHSLRLWLNSYTSSVRLIPVVSWLTPAHVPERYLLKPSLRYCFQRLGWRPDIVTGDLGYIHGQTKREIREKWKVAIVTKMKSDMSIIPPFETAHCVTCPQGQPLQWIEYNQEEDLHWFAVRVADPLCNQCWQVSNCPQEFGYPPSHHETLLGLIPLSTLPAQRLIKQARSWIEPTQSFEKNLLGLNSHFLNSLRLAWILGLVADSVMLLRNLALFERPIERNPLQELLPKQPLLDLGL